MISLAAGYRRSFLLPKTDQPVLEKRVREVIALFGYLGFKIPMAPGGEEFFQ
jgi:hypothetical protein